MGRSRRARDVSRETPRRGPLDENNVNGWLESMHARSEQELVQRVRGESEREREGKWRGRPCSLQSRSHRTELLHCHSRRITGTRRRTADPGRRQDCKDASRSMADPRPRRARPLTQEPRPRSRLVRERRDTHRKPNRSRAALLQARPVEYCNGSRGLTVTPSTKPHRDLFLPTRARGSVG